MTDIIPYATGTVGRLAAGYFTYQALDALWSSEFIQVWIVTRLGDWLKAQGRRLEDALKAAADSAFGRWLNRNLEAENTRLARLVMEGVYAGYVEAYKNDPETFCCGKKNPDTGVPLYFRNPYEYADFMTLDWERFYDKWLAPIDFPVLPPAVETSGLGSASGALSALTSATRSSTGALAAGIVGVFGTLSVAALAALAGWRK